jgi:hypothetical protein
MNGYRESQRVYGNGTCPAQRGMMHFYFLSSLASLPYVMVAENCRL